MDNIAYFIFYSLIAGFVLHLLVAMLKAADVMRVVHMARVAEGCAMPAVLSVDWREAYRGFLRLFFFGNMFGSVSIVFDYGDKLGMWYGLNKYRLGVVNPHATSKTH